MGGNSPKVVPLVMGDARNNVGITLRGSPGPPPMAVTAGKPDGTGAQLLEWDRDSLI